MLIDVHSVLRDETFLPLFTISILPSGSSGPRVERSHIEGLPCKTIPDTGEEQLHLADFLHEFPPGPIAAVEAGDQHAVARVHELAEVIP